MTTPRNIRFSDLENPELKEIWVLNKAQLIYNRPTAVTQTLVASDGSTSPLTIPATWIPIEVTAYASKQALLSSEAFRRNVGNRLLYLISREEADRLLESPEALEEQNRLDREILRGLRGQLPDVKETDTVETRDLSSKANSLLVAAFEGGSESGLTADNVLRRLQGSMNENDRAYVRSRTNDPDLLALLGA